MGPRRPQVGSAVDSRYDVGLADSLAPVAQWIGHLTSDYPGRCAVAPIVSEGANRLELSAVRITCAVKALLGILQVLGTERQPAAGGEGPGRLWALVPGHRLAGVWPTAAARIRVISTAAGSDWDRSAIVARAPATCR